MAKGVVTMAVVAGLCGLPAAARADGLRGIWQCRESQGGSVTLQFKTRNRLLYNGAMSRYSLLPGVIMVRDVFGPVAYRYQRSGDQLHITSPGGTGLQCRREPPGRHSAPPAATGDAVLAELHTRLCSWSSPSAYSGSYSHSSWLQFDGAGRLQYGSDSVFSGGNDVGSGNGNAVGGSYRIVGDAVDITLDDGTRAQGIVKRRNHDGSIDELSINDNLFSAQECQ